MGYIPQKLRYKVVGISPLNGFPRQADFDAYSAEHAVVMAINELTRDMKLPRLTFRGKPLPLFIVVGVYENDRRALVPNEPMQISPKDQQDFLQHKADKRADGTSKAFA